MYRLTGDIVARVGRPGTVTTAQREIDVSRWLAATDITVTEAIANLRQPVVVDDRPVTWWRLLPDHRPATPAELGSILRALHSLPIPSIPQLPTYDPFANLDQRIGQASRLDPADRTWLSNHLAELRARYERLPSGRPQSVIHGDAWEGNVAVPVIGSPILLDLEHVSIGYPDWDLIPMAVDYTDFARRDAEDYRLFVRAYSSHDVITTPSFRILADIQELRWVSFVISKSEDSDEARSEARHRIACLRGEIPRPWSWTAF